jgi:transgelin
MAIPPPGIKFKPSPMPFVQMENISHFLRACQAPPLNLQPHDVFLTVDLYESKDPAQVIQCIGAFSRVANKCAPSRFPTVIGPKINPGLMSPQGTGTPKVGGGSYGNRDRGTSNASNTSSAYNTNSKAVGAITPTRTGDSNSGRWSPTKNGSGQLSPGGVVSSWSKKEDEGTTAPAWNINQYGYMGGASQGNMGVTFGARRQITSAGPHVPSLAEKEKRRKEQEAEEERLRIQMEEAEHKRRVEREAEEERARIAEEERWAEETRKLRERERQKAAEEKRKWEEEERRWKLEEERRQQEEKEAEAKLEVERRRARGTSDARLQGQFLSQYQAEQARGDSGNLTRIQELELELARERERQYERERQERMRAKEHQRIEDHDMSIRMKEERPKSRARSRSRPREKNEDDAWREDEREYLKKEWAKQHDYPPPKPPRQQYEDAPLKPPRPQHEEAPQKPLRPLPEPVRVKKNNTGPSSRPLPDPAAYAAPPTNTYSTPAPNLPSRTDRFLSSNPAPQVQAPQTTYAAELGAFDSTAERDAEDRRRKQSQAQTKAGGWASKSLLEREMEMERQRQREWEEAQAQRESTRGGTGAGAGTGMGTGTTAGRRGIVGPRPPPAGR